MNFFMNWVLSNPNFLIALLFFMGAVGWWTCWVTFSIKALKQSVSALERSVEALKQSVSALEGAVRTLEARFDEHFGNGPNNIMARLRNEMRAIPVDERVINPKSPLALTPLGEEISEAIQADKVAQYYADEVNGIMNGKTAYKIQEFCFSFAKDLPSQLKEERADYYDKVVGTVAFFKGMPPEAMFSAAVGVVLRDRVLEMQGIMYDKAGAAQPPGA